MQKHEEVSGIIIGGEYQHVKLICPNGKTQIAEHIPAARCPVEWAKEQVARLKAEPTGTGKPISYYPDIFNGIYGAGEFTVLTNY